jgi:hypothetical protein
MFHERTRKLVEMLASLSWPAMKEDDEWRSQGCVAADE